MEPSENFYKLLVDFEGLELKAYLDSASIFTIGIGTIVYPNGQHVKEGDTCTEQEAYDWAKFEAEHKAGTLTGLLQGVPITQNQFDSVLSLVYNIGSGAFAASTLLKRIKGASGDIRQGFLMWDKAKINGVLTPIEGLKIRRNKEADLFLQKD